MEGGENHMDTETGTTYEVCSSTDIEVELSGIADNLGEDIKSSTSETIDMCIDRMVEDATMEANDRIREAIAERSFDYKVKLVKVQDEVGGVRVTLFGDGVAYEGRVFEVKKESTE
jgi:hypothetical protein